MMFTDGTEVALASNPDNPCQEPTHLDLFSSLAHLPISNLCEALGARLDGTAGSLQPLDDVTIVGMEISNQS
jgi:hypothetical protein